MPFSSLVIDAAAHDRDEELQRIAADWGSGLMRARERSSLPGDSWRQAQRLFRRFAAAVVDHEVARARALRGLPPSR